MSRILFRPRFLAQILYLPNPPLPQYLPAKSRQMPCCCPHPHPRFMATVTNPDSSWVRVERLGAIPYLVYTKPLLKSEQDDRDYRIIQLDNGLQATLVHDSKTDKAAASLDVAVGHLYDPVCSTKIPRLCTTQLIYLGRYAGPCSLL